MNRFRWRFATTGLAIGLAMVIFVDVLAQTSSQPEIWKKTPPAEHHNSIVKIIMPSGVGTGVVVSVDKDKPSQDGFLGYCLTAYHVVKEDKGEGKIRVEYRNGRRAEGGRVVAFDDANDLALVWIWVPSSISPVEIATSAVGVNSTLEFVGLGGGVEMNCCLRHFSGVAAATTNENTIYSDVVLLPGDSGGGVFNQRNELVGIISGGWFWFQHDFETDLPQTATWPGRACNLNPITKLISGPFRSNPSNAVEPEKLAVAPVNGQIN